MADRGLNGCRLSGAPLWRPRDALALISVRAQRAGDEADASGEEDEHDDCAEEARRLEVDLKVGDDAREYDYRAREREEPARD